MESSISAQALKGTEASSHHILCLDSLLLGEASRHGVRTHKQPRGGAHLVGNRGLLTPASRGGEPHASGSSSPCRALR